MNTHTHNRFTCAMCQIENQVMCVEERIQKMDEDRSPEIEDRRQRNPLASASDRDAKASQLEEPQNADDQQPERVGARSRYAVVYSAVDTKRILRTAQTLLGATRQAITLTEWLTKGDDDGISVTINGLVVHETIREGPYAWTLMLKTQKGRWVRGRLTIWREMS
jgi:hypothetical protein